MIKQLRKKTVVTKIHTKSTANLIKIISPPIFQMKMNYNMILL